MSFVLRLFKVHSLRRYQLHVSERRGISAADLENALRIIPQMGNLHLTTEEVSYIVAALQVSTNSTPNLSSEKVTEFKAPLANADLLYNKLTSIFYNSTSPNSTDSLIRRRIHNNTRSNRVTFGGTCSPHDPGCSLSGAKAEFQSLSSAPRKGYLTKACSEVLRYDQAVENALRNSGLSASAAISASNLDHMFRKFNGARSPASEDVTALEGLRDDLSRQGLGLVKQWKFILFTLCTSHGVETL